MLSNEVDMHCVKCIKNEQEAVGICFVRVPLRKAHDILYCVQCFDEEFGQGFRKQIEEVNYRISRGNSYRGYARVKHVRNIR